MSELHLDYLEEYKEYQRERKKKNTAKTVYKILEEIIASMIEQNHPRIKEIMKGLKYKRCNYNKDWVAAILSEAGVIEYTSCTRLQNQNSRPRKAVIVSICIFLGLCLDLSTQLLAAAGHTLRPDNELDDLYSFLIVKSSRDEIYTDGDQTIIEVCNDIMACRYGEIKQMDRLGPIQKAE